MVSVVLVSRFEVVAEMARLISGGGHLHEVTRY